VDPSQQWPYPQQGQPGPQYPQQQPPAQYPQQQYPPQQPPAQYPQQQQYPPQQPSYGNQPYSAAPYNIAPNSAAPYSGPPANPYTQPATGMIAVPPQRSRSRLPMLVIAAVCLLALLAVSIVVVALSKNKKEPVAGPGTAPTSYAGPVDPCLVGTWNQTSYQKVVDMTGTDVDKREGIGKVKMTGGGKRWTINADGTAVEDDAKTVYAGTDDKGRNINATFSGSTDWSIKTVGRTIEYAGKESTSSVVISVDGRKAGTINLEPNLDPNNYTCVGDVWRTSSAKDPDSFARYDKVK
jgi:hypothetical protein